MKILVVCQHYWPEPYPLPDICEELVKRGHEVTVLTDIPNYPVGYIYDDYKNGKNRIETHNGVQILRSFTIGRRKNILFRALNYISYAWSSSIYAKRIREEYDIVFANQTSPITMSLAALAYGKKHKVKVLMYCLDLWPACLAAGGVKKSSPIYKIFHSISKNIYSKMDEIYISSKAFRDYLTSEFGISDNRIEYLPQFADDGLKYEEHIFSDDITNLMFAGNIGSAQCIPEVLYAAKKLENVVSINWHFVGDGSALEDSIRLAKELKLNNVFFHGRKPAEEMNHYYSMADAMIVTLLDDPAISMTLPRKVQGYMAAGKPIIGMANGETAEVIREARCGFCAHSMNVDEFSEKVLEFVNSKEKKDFSTNARRYYEEHFSKEKFFETLELGLQKNSSNR